jgi:hypothetical protein
MVMSVDERRHREKSRLRCRSAGAERADAFAVDLDGLAIRNTASGEQVGAFDLAHLLSLARQ